MELDFPKIEEKILKFWHNKKIFEKLRKKNRGKKNWSFLDGPITANNPMGVHHAWGRTYKDLFQRYRAMQGFDQRFQNGFDCQGLWVEVEVEKEMGFKTKKDIETFGIDSFVELCKKRVEKYAKIQTEQSIRLGQWMDWKNSYYTMSEENNYAIWHFLKKCHDKKLIYKGKDAVPWCPRCGTAISQHEILTEDYKEVTHDSLYFAYPVLGRKNEFLLIWTTTPWTLPGNVAVAVDPKKEYAIVSGSVANNKYYVLKTLADSLNLQIKKVLKGKDLVGLEYQSPFDYLPRVKKSFGDYVHRVIATDPLVLAVSEAEGTGLIHIAPGAGTEDFRLGKKMKLPVIELIDEQANYLEGLGGFSGKNAKDNPQIITDYIKKKEAGKYFFDLKSITHRYPACWRCKNELVWRVVAEWYISMEKLREPLKKLVRKIRWIPSFGLEREVDWLKNMQDWLISKKRYWGLALPIFECADCGKFEVIGSKEELQKRAIKGWDKFKGRSPHRPWVDQVKIKCSGCSSLVSRIKDVGNPWLDAGIVPFSTIGYYKDRDYWKKWFPAEMVCESFPGQFKNWFYSIIVMSQVIEEKPPVRTIFGYASVRDEKGEEMHKSKGNAIWFDDAVKKVGADPMRWMYARQNPENNLLFGWKALAEIKRTILTLYNSFIFFKTYAGNERVGLNLPKSKNILDKWILSKLNNLVKKATNDLNSHNPGRATTAIEKFFVEDLSLWYIRRSRKRFHKTNNTKDRKAAIGTLHCVLLSLFKLMAPTAPFLSEEMYQHMRQKGMPESVHLCNWPKAEQKLINHNLEKKMEKVRIIVASALAERAKAGIKVRQPLNELRIKNHELRNERELLKLIKEEVNVKEMSFGRTLKLDTKITPELREEGIAREIIRQINELRKKAGLTPKDKISIQHYSTPELNRILEKHKKSILAQTQAKSLSFVEKPIGQEIKIDQKSAWLTIEKHK